MIDGAAAARGGNWPRAPHRKRAAQLRGDELAPKPAERAPGAVGFTFDEVLEASMDRMFPAAMERAMPLAERLLARQPPLSL